MASSVYRLPTEPGHPENVIYFSDGREPVVCYHDGAPCPRCETPRESWPKVWQDPFLRVCMRTHGCPEGYRHSGHCTPAGIPVAA